MAVVGVAIAQFAAGLSSVIGIAATNALFQLAGSLALSSLARALQPKPDTPRQPGIKTEVTTNGGINPVSFVLGTYATSGNEVAPPYSHGDNGATPNAKLTYIHDLGDIPGITLKRLIINDDYVTIGAGSHPTYGQEVEGRYQDRVWVIEHDGSQTTADSYLLGKYGSETKRPWASDMIGRGVPYVITTFRYKRKLFNALPILRYEVEGIPLYDPRLDTTVGGSGSHRWSTQSTWEFTDNPAVMIYNILRGINLPDGSVWGGESEAEDLPLANWFAAMNVCDESVALDAGGSQTRYRAGYEVSVDTTPASVIEELLKACAGQISEFGGVYKMVAGGPAAPVYFMTDDDIIVTDDQSFTPFPAIDETFNAVHASYPDPAAKWAPKDAPPRYSSTFEAQDQGRRLVADLNLPTVFDGFQVQRLMKGYIDEERRFRRHIFTLPPDAAALEPLDTISWTSARNTYTSKVFEVVSLADHLQTLRQTVAVRERDGDDFDWSTTDELPFDVSEPGVEEPAAQGIASWTVAASSITDDLGASRRPALLLSWNGTDIDDVDTLLYEIRVKDTAAVIATGSTEDIAAGSYLHSEGILPETEYEARAIFTSLTDRDFTWSAWEAATTGAIYVNADDLDESVKSDIVTFFEYGPFAFDAGYDSGPGTFGSWVIIMPEAAIGRQIDVDDIFLSGVTFDGRGAASGSAELEVEFQRATKEVGGAWNDWQNLKSVTYPVDSGWERANDTSTLSTYRDDAKWRIRMRASGNSFKGRDAVRDIRFVVRAVQI